MYADWAATDTEGRNARLSAEQRELIWALSGLSDALHRAGIAVYQVSLRLSLIHLDDKILYIALVSDISERKAMLDRLIQLTERDSLTGLYNRPFLMDELECIVERAVRSEEHQTALLYWIILNMLMMRPVFKQKWLPMLTVAHSLSRQTVAEFVEDRETLQYLGTIGVDFCQGYYIGEPKVEAIEAQHVSVV